MVRPIDPTLTSAFAAAPHDDREEVLRTARDRLLAGLGMVIATVIETWGSAPRGPGSLMAIDADGDFVGSVSGGCVETAVIAEVPDILASGRARVLEFGVSDRDAFAAGLACGGRIRVHVAPLTAEGRVDAVGFDRGLAPLEALFAARARRRPVALATALDGGRRLVDPAAADDPLADLAREVLATETGRLVATAAGEVFLEPHRPAPRLIVVGAVHIAETLVRLADLVGLAVTVIDPREVFLRPRRFDRATAIAGWPDELLPAIGLDASTAVVALTHDPKIDDRAIAAALASDAFYVGALGSRRTHAGRCERLAAAGVAPEALARIKAPIGLSIGARGPAEIALSIVAEIVAARRGREAP